MLGDQFNLREIRSTRREPPTVGRKIDNREQLRSFRGLNLQTQCLHASDTILKLLRLLGHEGFI